MRIKMMIPLCLALAFHPLSSRGEERVEEEARASFDRGLEAFHEQKYFEAADAFREAYRLKKTWKLLFNIGQAEAAARRYGLALEAFERYLAEGGDEVGQKRTDDVITELNRLRALVGMLEVTAPAGAVVRVDGVERGRAPLAGPILVSAGVEHHIVVKQGERVLLERMVRLTGNQTKRLEVGDLDEPAPASAATPMPSGEPGESEQPAVADEPSIPEVEPTGDERPKKPSALFWGGVGLTLATGVTAGVLWGVGANRADDYESKKIEYVELDTGAPDFAEHVGSVYSDMKQLRDDAEVYNKSAVVLTVVGGALLAGTIAVLAADLSSNDEETEETAALAVSPGGITVRF